jgi:hypothetical protein
MKAVPASRLQDTGTGGFSIIPLFVRKHPLGNDTVADDSVIATAVDFANTRLRTASATIGEEKSSHAVGEELAQQLPTPLCAMCS